jgi:hypothetical protein
METVKDRVLGVKTDEASHGDHKEINQIQTYHMRRGERYASTKDMIENEGKKNDNKDSLQSFQGPKKPP